MEKLQLEAIQLLKAGKCTNATDARVNLLRFLVNDIGLVSFYDFTRQSPYDTDLVVELLTNPKVKKALGVNESMVFEICSNVAAKA